MNLSYRQRNLLLIVGTILLGFIAYQFSFSKTLQAANQHEQLSQKLIEAKSASSTIQRLEQQLAKMNGNVNSEGYHPDKLFQVISQFCVKNDLKVLDFPEATKVTNGNYEVITHVLEVSGNYANIVELAYLVEQERKMGRISSLNFITEKNIQTKSKILKGKFYIQNIISLK